MTRNYIALFCFITIITAFLLEGTLGTHGFVVNRKLQATVEKRQHELDVKTLETEELARQVAHALDRDALLDNARRLGYAGTGETVYFFPEGTDGSETIAGSDGTDTAISGGSFGKRAFTGMHASAILAAAVGFAAAAIAVLAAMNRRGRAKRSEGGRRTKHGDHHQDGRA